MKGFNPDDIKEMKSRMDAVVDDHHRRDEEVGRRFREHARNAFLFLDFDDDIDFTEAWPW